jgi:hypothetical protein
MMIALALLLCNTAQALSYSYKSNGHKYAGQDPPPKCKDQNLRELNPDASIIRILPAPLTAEQRKARDAEEKLRQDEEDAKIAQSK